MLTVEDNATIVRAHYDAYNRRDVEKGSSLVSDDVKWINVPFNVIFSGRRGYREFLDNWTTAMPDSRVKIINLVPGEEWTAVEFVGRGTHSGPMVAPQGIISATQRKLDMKFCEFLRVKSGQIAEGHLYFDGATLMRQLGLLAPAASGQP